MSQTLHIGLLGLGTVGSGIPLILSLNKEKIEGTTGTSFIINKAFVRNIESKKNIANQYNITLTTELKEIIEDENIEIVVEAMGGVTFAKKAIEDALKNKKHVVTANKDLIAQYGDELTQLAQKNGVYLYYEAAVAGGIPILRTLTNSFSSDDIQLIQGIVNGTTNFMLTQMNQKNWSYEEALLEAQKLGFAESDP
ncbi:MAG: homoserine dehydrogenase, partial [Vagococcus sp.]